MSLEKIPSLRKSVGLTLVTIIGMPILWWLFFDFSIVGMTHEVKIKFSQIGLLINFIAGLSMIVRYLWLNRYKKRVEQIYKIDDLLVMKYDQLKRESYNESEQLKATNDLKDEQGPLYKEIESYIEFDKVESIHMIIGILGLTVGTLFQMIGAG
jgi:hypothetical protein